MLPIYKFEINRESINLNDPEKVIIGRVLDPGNGAFSIDSNYNTSGLMPVVPGLTYAFKDSSNSPLTVPVVVAYEQDKSYNFGETNISQISIPENIYYVRFSFPSSVDVRNISFSISNEPYSKYFGPRAYPIYKDDVAKDFELQTNQQFFRAKLSGKLKFVAKDYEWIMAQQFDFQFIVTIYISYDAGQTWFEYWQGTFWKTDCNFDVDAKLVTVTPTVKDEYNDVLAGQEKEYNLIELAPEIVPVKLDKRPMIQVYVPGESVIGCFLSGMWWEQECEAITNEYELEHTYYFHKNKTKRIVEVMQQGTPEIPFAYIGDPYTYGQDASYINGEYRFEHEFYQYITEEFTIQHEIFRIVRNSDNKVLWSLQTDIGQTYPGEFTLTPVAGNGATGNVKIFIHDVSVWARFVCDVENGAGVNTYDIPDNDIVENNRNYTRVVGYDFPNTIIFYAGLSTTPTQWGLCKPGYYFEMFTSFSVNESYPVARSSWGNFSIWFAADMYSRLAEESFRSPYTLRDAYPLASVISVLLAQVAPGITHQETTDYSQFLYGENPISGINQRVLITPKSNMISLGYDQPAQKAPITLKRVLDMLRDCFRCYWFIDDQNRFRIEHIEYFRNGGAYPGTPDYPKIGRDLTLEKVTRTGKAWSTDTSQFEYDKPEMAARYQFGWMDDVTQLFDGNPIDIVSKYVNPDNVEQIDVAQFSSDVDYILLNPGEISSDGFVLLAAINPVYNFNAIAEEGQEFSVSQQVNLAAGTQLRVTLNCENGIFPGNYSATMINGTNIGQNVYNDLPKIITLTTSAQTLGFNRGTVTTNGSVSITVEVLNQPQLPYINFQLNGVDHILQNAYVAFIFLQQYYFYDMPARFFKYNGEIMEAYGIKKLKTQKLKFPAYTDPDMMKLIKTQLGNGTIQKLSINLSSRNANATLKYDIE